MVLFIDSNDVCRAAAAAVYHESVTGVPAAHAGVLAEAGTVPSRMVLEAAQQAGIDLDGVTAVPVRAELLRMADCICAVTAAIADHLRTDYPEIAHKVCQLEIPDPFGQGAQAYADCMQTICEQVEALTCG